MVWSLLGWIWDGETKRVRQDEHGTIQGTLRRRPLGDRRRYHGFEGGVSEGGVGCEAPLDGTVLVDIDDIDWVDAAGDYMCIHVKGETLILRSTLKHLMSKLDPDVFKRIHRSTVVNLSRIVKSTPLHKGEYMLFLECGAQLKVSRNYRQDIKVFLSER